MAIHDWTRVPAGIFHDFHHGWICEIARVLNRGLLPGDYYAMAEQQMAELGPEAKCTGQTDEEFYRRKKSSVVVRHDSDDHSVAMLEIIAPGNKATRNAVRACIDSTRDMLKNKIHLMIVDLFPPTPRDPHGIFAAIWRELFHGVKVDALADKPLTLVSFDADQNVEAFLEPVAVGDALPPMALFLEPRRYVSMPLEATYQAAWQAVPRRWQRVLEG
jgi:hypothetical protein